MRVLVFGCFAASILAIGLSPAEAAPQFPRGAVALEAQLLAAQGAEAKAFIKDEASNEAASRIISEETPRNAARKFGSSGNDVSAMAFLILMQASRDADTNVSELVSGVQSADASREDVRQQSMTSSGISGSQQAQLSAGSQTAQQAQGHAFVSLLPAASGENPFEKALKPDSTAVTLPAMSLQDAMDRQNQIDDLLAAAMKRVTQPS
jgi:hypothetical protein